MPIKIDDIREPNFWQERSDPETNETPFTVILPSGRAADATCGHLALVSDALYTHEIAVMINNYSIQSGQKGLKIKSMLDIDYYDYLSRERNNNDSLEFKQKNSIINSNLLVLATADINVITKLLFHESKAIENFKIGYRQPYEDCIIVGGQGKTYAVMAYPNVGVLGLYKVPWASENRIALFCGGIMASGTLAASQLLLRYLEGAAKGNNSYNEEIPIRIVSSTLKDYTHIKLYPTSSCIPQHELRNVTRDFIIHE
jgi:hypothetical protein